MALRNIITKEEKSLRRPSRQVVKFDDRLHTLLDDMRETLFQANGVGLAAPQVGVNRRVVIVTDENDEVIELINPEVISADGEQEGYEGCLSVPGFYGVVRRPMNVTVKAQNRDGNEFTVSGEGLLARAFCHEIDHLDGRLYTDIVLGTLITAEEMEAMMTEDGDEE